ncbi:hypothetical protein [Radicibacter daui]|uniref:hypothetical protein n=1 Tax=Radicibacter daui TaxID=3064829 RepID=UPI004046EC23
MSVEFQLMLGLAEARLVFDASVAAGRSPQAAFNSAVDAFEDHLDEDVLIEDVEDLLVEALELDAGETLH